MKTLVFSDTHLRLPVEQGKVQLLKRIIEGCDRVIINGDFWDGYYITFDQFIQSEWSSLFPLLKNKQTVYMYGNHDRKTFSDERVALFCQECTMSYKLISGDKKFHFEHGNAIYPTPDEKINDRRILRFSSQIFNSIEKVAVKYFGYEHMITFLKTKNILLKSKGREKLDKDEYLVCGHTHAAEIDEKKLFINTGFMKFGMAQYIYIENGQVTAFTETYECC